MSTKHLSRLRHDDICLFVEGLVQKASRCRADPLLFEGERELGGKAVTMNDDVELNMAQFEAWMAALPSKL